MVRAETLIFQNKSRELSIPFILIITQEKADQGAMWPGCLTKLRCVDQREVNQSQAFRVHSDPEGPINP